MWRGGQDARSASLRAAFGPEDLAHGRASFEVSEDVEAARQRMSRLGHHAKPAGGILGDFTRAHSAVETATHSYDTWRSASCPCVLSNLETVKALLHNKRLAVFLDYDGTLTPIVSNPDEAVLSQQMRDVVRSVAKLFPTAIISGRGREKVENFVKLSELYYAGSHGMDIAGPSAYSNGGPGAHGAGVGVDSTFQPAAHFRPLIDKIYSDLCTRLASIPGSSVEHNTFCVSAHFRNCEGELWQEVVQAVEQVVSDNPELRITRGRKVVEIRPKVNWHKGTALEHLLAVLGLKGQADVVALYIGDDHTDEDAFRTLRDSGQGFGVLVSTKVKESTAAKYTVRDPTEVQAFLTALVSWGQTDSSGWHKSGGWPPCGGSLQPVVPGSSGGAPAAAAGAAHPGSSGGGHASGAPSPKEHRAANGVAGEG